MNYYAHPSVRNSPHMGSINFTEGLTQKKQVQTDFEYESSAMLTVLPTTK